MTTRSTARPTTGAGHPTREGNHMTQPRYRQHVGPQKLAHALYCIHTGDITLNEGEYTTKAGATLTDAVYRAGEELFTTIGDDGWPTITAAGLDWLATMPPLPAPVVFLAEVA